MNISLKKITLLATLLAAICAFVVPAARAADDGKAVNKAEAKHEARAVAKNTVAKKAGGKKAKPAKKSVKAKKAKKAKKSAKQAKKAKRARKHG